MKEVDMVWDQKSPENGRDKPLIVETGVINMA
jgi:hypothetical protein